MGAVIDMDAAVLEEIAMLKGEQLQRAILAELVTLNARLARAEVMLGALTSGKSAKWIGLLGSLR